MVYLEDTLTHDKSRFVFTRTWHFLIRLMQASAKFQKLELPDLSDFPANFGKFPKVDLSDFPANFGKFPKVDLSDLSVISETHISTP